MGTRNIGQLLGSQSPGQEKPAFERWFVLSGAAPSGFHLADRNDAGEVYRFGTNYDCLTDFCAIMGWA